MASNFLALKPAQAELADKITQYGLENGYSPEVTAAMISLANQESNLGKDPNNPVSRAAGTWQFMGASHIKDELAVYRQNRPDGQYANWSANQVFHDQDAVMAVMFEQVKEWKREFDSPGSPLPSRLEQKLENYAALSETVHSDFNSYVFYRHNTSAKQTNGMVYADNVGILETNADISNYTNLAYSMNSAISVPQQPSPVADLAMQVGANSPTFRPNETGMQVAQNTYAGTINDTPSPSDILNSAGHEGTDEQKARLAELLAERLKDYRPIKGDLSATLPGNSSSPPQLFSNDAGGRPAEPEDNQFSL